MMKATVVTLFCLMAIASSAPVLRGKGKGKLAAYGPYAEVRRLGAFWGGKLQQGIDDLPDVPEVDASSPCADNPCKNGGFCVDVRGAEVDDSDIADIDAELDADTDVDTNDVDVAADVDVDVDVDVDADVDTNDVDVAADVDVDADVDTDDVDVATDVGVDTNDADVDVGADSDVNEDDVNVDIDVADDSDDDDDADYVCVCPVGFFGDHCEEEIDEEAVAAEAGGDS